MNTHNPGGIHPVLLQLLSNATTEELITVNEVVKDFPDAKVEQFAMVYRTKRKDPQAILLLTLLGFVLFAGIQRFVVGQIGMGILYFFTGGLCLVGTIYDLVNYNNIAMDYNEDMIRETLAVVNMGR